MKKARSYTFRFAGLVLALFLLPSLVSAAVWAAKDRPSSWREASWGSSGILPPAAAVDGSVIHIMAARTGGMKGAFSVHSWIVTKRAGESVYNRYDKVGWGSPVRLNAYAADALWYSNPPTILATLRGEQAERLIPKIEAAIRAYPYAQHGDYRIWPGPNSNSFVAHVLDAVPEIGISLPPTAVGRDFKSDGGHFAVDPDWSNIRFGYSGLFGFAAGTRYGLELHFMGLVAGIDIDGPAFKLPGIGRVGFSKTAIAGSS